MTTDFFIGPGGGDPGSSGPGGPGTIGTGGVVIGPGGSGSGGTGGTSASIAGYAGGLLSSVLGIPAINWGRLAAFLLGLILIAFGLYMLKSTKGVIKVVVGTPLKHARRAAEAAVEEASAA